jgi:thymidylate synthase (FAD)
VHVVEPKAYLIADMGCLDATREYLDALGAKEWQTPAAVASDNELLTEVAGRTCYKSFGTELNANLTRVRDDHMAYIGNILKTKHGSVLEHASSTVALVDVSRILTHELVRHRAGCAYSQESMRFVRMDDMGMFIPSCIKKDDHARHLFEDAVMKAEMAYAALVEHMITDGMDFNKKKEITSAIRRIAPSGHSTNIVVTANHRAWRHLIELRTATGAEEEIRIVFHQVANLFYNKYPAFYQDMIFDQEDYRPGVHFVNGKI